jgi:hypothetical protein
MVVYVVAWVALLAAVMVIGWLTARLAAGEALRRDYFRARQARLRRRQAHLLAPTTGVLGNLVQFPSRRITERRIRLERKSAG